MSNQPRANGALLAKLAAAAITYGFTLLLARLMSPDAFGQVVFFLNAAVLMAVVGARGQQLALLRFLPGLTGFGRRRLERCSSRTGVIPGFWLFRRPPRRFWASRPMLLATKPCSPHPSPTPRC